MRIPARMVQVSCREHSPGELLSRSKYLFVSTHLAWLRLVASHVDLAMDQEAGALSGCRENPFFRLSLFLAALDSNSTLPVSPVTNLLRFCHLFLALGLGFRVKVVPTISYRSLRVECLRVFLVPILNLKLIILIAPKYQGICVFGILDCSYCIHWTISDSITSSYS